MTVESEDTQISVSTPTIDGDKPSGRGGHSANMIARRMFIFGGHYVGTDGTFEYSDEMWYLDMNTMRWSQVKKRPSSWPEGRYAHATVTLDHKILMFGGCGTNGKALRDLWVFDSTTMIWSQCAHQNITTPSARLGHSMISFPGSCEVWLIGGSNGKKCFSDVYVLNTRNFSWKQIKITGNFPPRTMHASLVSNSKILLFGGMTFDLQDKKIPCAISNDLYSLDTTTLVWERVRTFGTGPSRRYGHRITATSEAEKFLVLGGWQGKHRMCAVCQEEVHVLTCPVSKFDIQGTQGDAVGWIFDLKSLSFEANLEISSIYGHSAVEHGDRVLIYGGWDGNKATSLLQIIENI